MSGKGYIGKISAIVTVNTADASRAFNRSGKEAQTYAQGMRRAIEQATRDAGKSFDNIFTPFQKLQRALEASRRADFNLGNTPELKEQIRTVEQLALAARQLATPLGAATKQFDGLALSVQQGFGGALSRTQAELIRVRDTVQTATDGGEAGFRAVTAQVNQTIASIRQLAEASQKVSALTTGQELAFSDPRLSANLNAAATAGQRAVALPRRVIESDPQIAQLTAQINRVSELAVAAAARVKSAFGGAEAEAAQRDYERLNAVLERSIARLNEKYRLFIDTEQAERNLKELQAAIAEIRAAEDFRITGNFQNARQVQDELQRVLALRDQLSSAQNSRIQPLVIEALDAAASGDLDASREKIEALRQALEGEIKVNVDTREASSRLAVLQKESEELSQRGATGGPQGPSLPPGFGGRADAGLGASLTDPSRQLDSLKGGIISVKSQIDQLPNSVKSRFIPSILLAEQEFRKLAALGPSATAEQIEAATATVTRLGVAAANASKFTKTLGDSFDGSRVAEFSARLEALRGVLLSAGAGAGTDAARKFEVLRKAMLDAAASGDFSKAAASLNRLEKEAIEAAAAFSGISAGNITTKLQRAGDIGRAGVDKFSLALNQAAFAIDDFFSATGGIEFKLRAVSNNLTQLGFILGGTTGLWLSLGAAVGGQAAVALSKFIFETDKADAALKALNAALEENKRNVDQLAESYRRLADQIAKAVLSPRDNLSRDRGQQRDEIVRQRRAAEEEAFASLSPEVARVRGERELLKKKQEESNSIEERVRIAKKIRENLDLERALLENRGSIEAEGLLRESAGRTLAAQEVRLNRARLRRTLGIPEMPGESADDLEAVVARARDRRDAANRTVLPGATSVDQTRRQLQALQASLGSATQAREDLVRSLPERTPGASVTRVDELDATIKKLEERIEVVSAVLGGQLASELIDANFRIQDSLTKAAESISATGIESALSAQRDKLAREVTAIADELASVADPARAEALKEQQRRIEEQSESILSAARSAEQFADVLRRVSTSLVDTVASEARNIADQARRDANAAAAGETLDITRPEDREFLDRRRQRAEQSARDADDSRRVVRDDARRLQRRFEQDVAGGLLGEDLKRAIRERDEAQRVLDAGNPGDDLIGARRRLERAQANIDRGFEDSPAGRAATAAADRADIEAQMPRQLEDSIGRGRELLKSQADKAAEELERSVEDMMNATNEIIDALDPQNNPGDVQAVRDAVERFVDGVNTAFSDAARSAAPAIAELFDSVQNAVAQGPSRAALNVADVSTSEGSRELTRLLRGDDAARNVNIAQLERQNQSLLTLIGVMTKVEQKIGMTIDLK